MVSMSPPLAVGTHRGQPHLVESQTCRHLACKEEELAILARQDMDQTIAQTADSLESLFV